MITFYNWDKLCQHSDQDNAGILVLTLATLKGYNKIIAGDSKELMEKLNIPKIPPVLFHRKYLRLNRFGGIKGYYQCNEPLSYFKNPKFLYYKIPLKTKIEYLWMVSMRRINDENNYIPEDYVDSKRWNNLLIERKNGRLYFIPENSSPQTRT